MPILSRKTYQELLVGLPHVLLVPTGYDDKLVRVLLRPAESGYSPDTREYREVGNEYDDVEYVRGDYPSLHIVWRGAGRNRDLKAWVAMKELEPRLIVDAKFGNVTYFTDEHVFGDSRKVSPEVAERLYGLSPDKWDWESYYERGRKLWVIDHWFKDPSPFIEILEERGIEVPYEEANSRDSRTRRAKKAFDNEYPGG